MEEILQFITVISVWTMLITPFTLIIGIINAIKKPEREAKGYIIMAVISAYLIIIPLMYISFTR